MANSFEQRPETDNQAVNQITKVSKDTKERMAFDNLRLGERYIKGELRLIMHVRLAEKDYVAVFQRCADAARYAETADALSDSAQNKAARDLKRNSADIKERDEQSVVLVGNVEIMNSPEHVISTLVRVGNVNRIYSTLSHALYSSMTLGLVFRGFLPERESDLPPRSLRESDAALGASDFNQLPNEMVKGTSEIVNNVSGNKSEFNGRGLNISDAIDRLSRLRIVHGFDAIRIAIQELLPSDFKITDLLFGPFNFYAY
jgi:hypothetical protein